MQSHDQDSNFIFNLSMQCIFTNALSDMNYLYTNVLREFNYFLP